MKKRHTNKSTSSLIAKMSFREVMREGCSYSIQYKFAERGTTVSNSLVYSFIPVHIVNSVARVNKECLTFLLAVIFESYHLGEDCSPFSLQNAYKFLGSLSFGT